MPDRISAARRVSLSTDPAARKGKEAVSTSSMPSTQSAPRGRRAGRPASGTPGTPCVFERLEQKQLMSVSTNAGGWTVVKPPADARVVYVSSSQGQDGNSGLSPATPVRTLAKAASLLRDRTGDEMLLRRGDTWHESFGYWLKSGRSAAEPMVIGAYGLGARPTVATGSSTAFATGRKAYPRVDHLALIGIRLYADARDPASPTYRGAGANGDGIVVASATDDLLIEDCAIQDYANNVNLGIYYGPVTNVRIRRSLIADAYNPSGTAQGLFAYGTNGLTLDGNVFDHNGWNERAGAKATMFSHDAYIKENVTGFVARGNVFANAASHGLQARSGGTVEGNVFLNDPIGLSFGLVNGSPVTAGGVSGSIRNNVFLGGRTISGLARGWGVEVGNTRPGARTVIEGNVFAHGAGGIDGYAISLGYGSGVTNVNQAVGLNDIVIRHNVVYDWGRGLNFGAGLKPGGTGATAINRVTVAGNDFQQMQTPYVIYGGTSFDPNQQVFIGNRYSTATGTPMVSGPKTMSWAAWSPGREGGGQATVVAYLNPTRTAASFAAANGAGWGDAAFVAAARANDGQGWDDRFTAEGLGDYVREGFGMVG